jgi:hypothetical protein
LLSKNARIKIYRTVILPVLYAHETLSVALRKEHRLRVFLNRMLRERVIGKWRKLHNEELYGW